MSLRGRATVLKWVEAAMADGWNKIVDTKTMQRYRRPKSKFHHKSEGEPEDVFELVKDNFRAWVWVTKKSSYTSMTMRRNGSEFDMYNLGQKDGYDYGKLQAYAQGCPRCNDISKTALQRFGLNEICAECVKSIEDFSAKLPKEEPKKVIGTAEITCRYVHGKDRTDVVKNYRVLASLQGEIVPGAFWEPYNGPYEEMATSITNAVSHALTITGYTVTTKYVHTDFYGNELPDPKSKK